tara:strand:- start:30 stop:479 length:450 start_codon:yes stop_codon:yes gene_type:complete
MGKEDRIKRRIKKKEAKIKELKPKSTSSAFSVVNKSAVKGNTGRTKVDGCGSAAQQRGSTSCSKSSKGKKLSNKSTISRKRLVQTKETKENNRLREQNKRLENRNKQQAPKIRAQEERQNKRKARNPKKKTSEIGPFITQKQRQQLKKK